MIKFCLKLVTFPDVPVSVVSLIDFDGVRLRLWTAATSGHIFHPPHDMSLESDGGMIYCQGKTEKTLRKTCPSAILYTTNPTWIDPGANLGLRSKKSRRLTAWAATLPKWGLRYFCFIQKKNMHWRNQVSTFLHSSPTHIAKRLEDLVTLR
jgi:hypothetical protein